MRKIAQRPRNLRSTSRRTSMPSKTSSPGRLSTRARKYVAAAHLDNDARAVLTSHPQQIAFGADKIAEEKQKLAEHEADMQKLEVNIHCRWFGRSRRSLDSLP